MQFEEALQFYKQQRRKILAQHFADFIISWDMQTDAAPQSISADAEYGAVLSEYSYELVSDENSWRRWKRWTATGNCWTTCFATKWK